MPTYNYECSDHGMFELTLPLRKWDDHKPCPTCAKSSEQVVLPSGNSGVLPGAIVVHVDSKGNFRFPGVADAKCPEGFERRELKTIREVENFERQVNAKLKSESQQHRENEERAFAGVKSQSRSELRQAMQRMSSQGRAFAEAAIRINNARKSKSTDCGFHLDILHNDSSNRQEYRDERTGWKERRA